MAQVADLIREAFDLFDYTKSGALDVKVLHKVVRTFFPAMNRQQVAECIDQMKLTEKEVRAPPTTCIALL